MPVVGAGLVQHLVLLVGSLFLWYLAVQRPTLVSKQRKGPLGLLELPKEAQPVKPQKVLG